MAVAVEAHLGGLVSASTARDEGSSCAGGSPLSAATGKQAMTRIFNEAQQSYASHHKNVRLLQKVQRSMTDEGLYKFRAI